MIRAPMLNSKMRFLNTFRNYLREKHPMKNGDEKAPAAPPKVRTPIKKPLMVVFYDCSPNY
jgi:hypothetical protein